MFIYIYIIHENHSMPKKFNCIKVEFYILIHTVIFIQNRSSLIYVILDNIQLRRNKYK